MIRATLGEAATDACQRELSVDRPSINCSLCYEVARRRSHENIVARKRYGRAIGRMKALLRDGPCRSTIPADTKPNRSRCNHDAGMNRVRADFVDITINVDRGSPSQTAVRRARNAPDMDVGEKHGPVRGCGYRANPKRWPDELAVY